MKTQTRGYNNQNDRRNNDRRGRYNNRRNQNNRGRRQDTQRQQGPRHNPGDAKFLMGRDENQEQITITEEFDFEKATFDKTNVLADDKKADAPAADENKKKLPQTKQKKLPKKKRAKKPKKQRTQQTKISKTRTRKKNLPNQQSPLPSLSNINIIQRKVFLMTWTL